MMKADDWKEYEDDGRTIADMSGVTRRSLFGIRPHDPADLPAEHHLQDMEERDQKDVLTREERWWAFLGMMKAVLLVGLCFAAGLALVILAFQFL